MCRSWALRCRVIGRNKQRGNLLGDEAGALLAWAAAPTAIGSEKLLEVAQQAADAMSLRPGRYVARDNSPERRDISLNARFAVRYGGRQETSNEQVGIRQGEVRAAFNSPFAPFVLGSTSDGQEGIDFHWWSHSVMRWNLPSNPVDFEQREGRVNRFAGHAVRKNVAERHWHDVLRSTDARAWRAAFAAVEEDLVEMLARRGADADALPTIDLRPPGSVNTSPNSRSERPFSREQWN